MNRNALMEKVIDALKNFFENDSQLLTLKANERSISHKLAEHLQQEFIDFNVDCEYNRRGKSKKTLPRVLFHDIKEDDQEAKTIFPDILIHKRNIQTDNLLVIEVKKSNSSESEVNDIIKLEAFTNPNGDFKYEVGLFMVFDVNNQNLKDVRFFKNGNEVDIGSHLKAKLEVLGYGE